MRIIAGIKYTLCYSVFMQSYTKKANNRYTGQHFSEIKAKCLKISRWLSSYLLITCLLMLILRKIHSFNSGLFHKRPRPKRVWRLLLPAPSHGVLQTSLHCCQIPPGLVGQFSQKNSAAGEKIWLQTDTPEISTFIQYSGFTSHWRRFRSTTLS